MASTERERLKATGRDGPSLLDRRCTPGVGVWPVVVVGGEVIFTSPRLEARFAGVAVAPAVLP